MNRRSFLARLTATAAALAVVRPELESASAAPPEEGKDLITPLPGLEEELVSLIGRAPYVCDITPIFPLPDGGNEGVKVLRLFSPTWDKRSRYQYRDSTEAHFRDEAWRSLKLMLKAMVAADARWEYLQGAQEIGACRNRTVCSVEYADASGIMTPIQIDRQPLRFDRPRVFIEPEVICSVTNGVAARSNPAWLRARNELAFDFAGVPYSLLFRVECKLIERPDGYRRFAVQYRRKFVRNSGGSVGVKAFARPRIDLDLI